MHFSENRYNARAVKSAFEKGEKAAGPALVLKRTMMALILAMKYCFQFIEYRKGELIEFVHEKSPILDKKHLPTKEDFTKFEKDLLLDLVISNKALQLAQSFLFNNHVPIPPSNWYLDDKSSNANNYD